MALIIANVASGVLEYARPCSLFRFKFSATTTRTTDNVRTSRTIRGTLINFLDDKKAAQEAYSNSIYVLKHLRAICNV